MVGVQRNRVELASQSTAGWWVAVQVTFGTAYVLFGVLVDADSVTRIIWPIIGLCWMGVAWQQWRRRVCFDRDGVIVGGRWLARRILDWSEVDRFEVRNEHRELGAWSKDGRWLHLRTYPKNHVDEAYVVAGRLDQARPHHDP